MPSSANNSVSQAIPAPATAEQAMQTALAHHQAGRLAVAEAIYRRVLAQQAQHPDALHLLGVLAGQTGRPDLASELIQRAIHINPKVCHYYNNLSQTLLASGKFEQAAAACYKAIQLKGDYVEAHYNLGDVLREMGRHDDAIAAYRRAIALRPEMALAHNNQGASLAALGQLESAAAAYNKAIAINPRYADAYLNLANIHKDQAQLDQAIALCDRAIALNPADSELQQNRIYLLHFHPLFDGPAIRREQEAWNLRHAQPLAQKIQPHTNDRAKRRIRIGYVSPYFRHHVIGYNLLPLLANHDRQQFEIHCFSSVPRGDSLTAQFQGFADAWHNVAGLANPDLAELIRKKRIDILVDLTLHLHGTRLLAFARKPAPVQVTFAGYPGGTGLQTIDYRLTDPFLDPPGASDTHYVEQSIRLDGSFWCYDPHAGAPAAATPIEPGPLPARRNRKITFGCLNNFCKVNDHVLDLWARVLRATPGSELLLSAPAGAARQRVAQTLGKRGILPTRLRFTTTLPRPEYLQLYQQIDLGLETFPYNGHTTSLDAFWMGVPVPTLVGQTAVARAGFSHLSNLGLTDLAAQTPDAYVDLVAALAADHDRLQLLRSSLRQRLLDSPLADAPRFAKNIEAAYLMMWAKWCQK